jgi:hypothetical protein
LCGGEEGARGEDDLTSGAAKGLVGFQALAVGGDRVKDVGDTGIFGLPLNE